MLFQTIPSYADFTSFKPSLILKKMLFVLHEQEYETVCPEQKEHFERLKKGIYGTNFNGFFGMKD